MREVIDLSIGVDDGTPTYPGDPQPRLCAASTIADSGFNVLRVDIGSHTGTHVDAPYHFLESGARIDELPLERFVGPGAVVDVSHLGPRQPILWQDIERHADGFEDGVIVLLRTGWSRFLHSPRYFAHPFLDADACEEVLARGVRAIGIDAMSLDATPTGAVERDAFPCHDSISRAGGVIVENLANLAAVDFPEPLVSVLPLRLVGGDGAPTRAVAMRL